ncbi:radical SAM family heme chaperone HemW [Oceanobacillus kimchii]|uniref:radical SAM family heme chaperone HemW n=1 Tax=Oceanobacillus kimchii TaxID=746691 RepID=UPI000367304D|nr:radical SAM family heme chaperone HemW [Oceanobacillus kimchii]
MNSIKAVYIHIPFCKQICHYCNFVKYFYMENKADDYVEALIREIDCTVSGYNVHVDTIYMGGGTPTALNVEQLKKLFGFLDRKFNLGTCKEFTIEINPGDIDQEKAHLLSSYGVNRVSFGVQVMDDDMLRKIGRMHSVKDVYETVNLLTKNEFHNISLDLIYALPNQTVEHFEQTLNDALQFGLPHYSTYALQIEPKTVFYHKQNKGQLQRPPEDAEVEMYRILQREMINRGIEQYEISNFAKPGYESNHNLTYWNNDYYYGFGAGAHGYIPGKRTSNIKPLGTYIRSASEGSAIDEIETITIKDQIEEELFLQLRKTSGISKKMFQQKYGVSLEKLYANELQVLLEQGLLRLKDGNYRLTDRGMLLGDQVFSKFLMMQSFDDKIIQLES